MRRETDWVRREGLGEDKDWAERKTASGEDTFSEQEASGIGEMTLR